MTDVGCVQKNEKDKEGQAAKPAAELPAGQVKLSPEQQMRAGLEIGPTGMEPLPKIFSITAQIEVPTGKIAQVLPPVLGYVEAPTSGIPAVGSRVHRGQTLAIVRQDYSASDRLQLQVNLQEAEAAIKTAQAQRELAQTQLDRSKRLYQDKIAPLKQVQQDEAALKTAEVAYQNAVERKQKYAAAMSSASPGGGVGPSSFVLTAPIAGSITAADITPGQLVEPSHPLFSLIDTSVVWVKVPVPEAELGSIGRANTGELTVSAFPGRIYRLRWVASSVVVDPSTHTSTQIYAVENASGELKPGMVASVRLQSSHVAPMLVVPETALVHEANATVVFLQISKDTFQRQPVALAFTTQGRAAIESGLQPGQKVVTRGASLVESQLQRENAR